MRAAFIILAMVQFAAAQWTRITYPQFEVLSDATGRDTRQLTHLLSQISSILPSDGPRAVRIFLFANESEFRPYRDDAEGFFATGVERDYMVLHAGPVSNRVVFHEFTHLLLSHSPSPLPLWFDEGTAELYSNLDLSAKRLRVGEPIPEHLITLRTARWLTGAELASVTRTSSDYKAGMFYAESWALVHMLNLAPAWRDGMPRFVLALTGGRDVTEAFQSAFGRSIDAALPGSPQLYQCDALRDPGRASAHATSNRTASQLRAIKPHSRSSILPLRLHRDNQARVRWSAGSLQQNPQSPGNSRHSSRARIGRRAEGRRALRFRRSHPDGHP